MSPGLIGAMSPGLMVSSGGMSSGLIGAMSPGLIVSSGAIVAGPDQVVRCNRSPDRRDLALRPDFGIGGGRLARRRLLPNVPHRLSVGLAGGTARRPRETAFAT